MQLTCLMCSCAWNQLSATAEGREQSGSNLCRIRDRIVTSPHGKRILRTDVFGGRVSISNMLNIIYCFQPASLFKYKWADIFTCISYTAAICRTLIYWIDESIIHGQHGLAIFLIWYTVYSAFQTLSPLWISLQLRPVYIYSFRWCFFCSLTYSWNMVGSGSSIACISFFKIMLLKADCVTVLKRLFSFEKPRDNQVATKSLGPKSVQKKT